MNKKKRSSNFVSKLNKQSQSHSDSLGSNLDEFDSMFRFDDKYLGKRGNIMNQPQTNSDGYYDFVLNSDKDISFQLYRQNSKTCYNVELINEVDEKKNQKMVRCINNIDPDCASDLTFSDIDDVSEQKEKQVQPTVQKKNSVQFDPQNVDKSKTTNSQPNKAKQTDFQIAQNDPQAELRWKSKNEIKTYQKSPQKMNKKGKTKAELTQIKQKLDKRHQEDMKNLKKKRTPRVSESDQEQTYRPPMFSYEVNIQRGQPKEIYEPFGTFGVGRKYPKRLRLNRLRYQLNERKQYDRGILKKVVLVDDQLGRDNARKMNEVMNQGQTMQQKNNRIFKN